MPIYTHKCRDCACLTEAEYSIKETKDVPCEVCGGETKRIITPASTAFVLKGDDWHRDGYGAKHKKGN